MTDTMIKHASHFCTFAQRPGHLCCISIITTEVSLGTEFAQPHAGKAVGVARPRTSSGSEGGAGQLVRSRAGSGRWGLAPAPAGALHAGAAQAQLRAKNRMIADLRTQKQQLTGVCALICSLGIEHL